MDGIGFPVQMRCSMSDPIANPIVFTVLAHGTQMDSFSNPSSLLSVLGNQVAGNKCVLFGPAARYTDPGNSSKKQKSSALEFATGGGKNTGVQRNVVTALNAILADLKNYKDKFKDRNNPQIYRLVMAGFSRGAATCIQIANALDGIVENPSFLKNLLGVTDAKISKELNEAVEKFKDFKKENPGLILKSQLTLLDTVAGLGRKSEKASRRIPPFVEKISTIVTQHETRRGFKPQTQDTGRLYYADPTATSAKSSILPGHHSAHDHARGKSTDDVVELAWYKMSSDLAAAGVKFNDGALPKMPLKNGGLRDLNIFDNADEKLKLYHRIKLQNDKYAGFGKGFLEKLGIGRLFNVWKKQRKLETENYVSASHFFMDQEEQAAFKAKFPLVFKHCFQGHLIPPEDKETPKKLLTEKSEVVAFYSKINSQYCEEEVTRKTGREPEAFTDKENKKVQSKIEKLHQMVKDSIDHKKNITSAKVGFFQRALNVFKGFLGNILTAGKTFFSETATTVMQGAEQVHSGQPLNVMKGMAKILLSPVAGSVGVAKDVLVNPIYKEIAAQLNSPVERYIPSNNPQVENSPEEKLAKRILNELRQYKRNTIGGFFKAPHIDIADKMLREVDHIMTRVKPESQYEKLQNLLEETCKRMDKEGYNYRRENADGTPYTLYERLTTLNRLANPRPQNKLVRNAHDLVANESTHDDATLIALNQFQNKFR